VRMLGGDPIRPRSPNQVKKQFEDIAKNERQFHFAIRANEDDRVLGFVRLAHIEWTHGMAMLTFGIGEAEARGKGYAREALTLVLQYAFTELNLHRVWAVVPAYNTRAQHLLERAGFVCEVRRREVIHRDGKRWDGLVYGLLHNEWRP